MRLSILAPLAAVVGAGAMLWAGAATSQSASQSTGASQPTECDYTAYGRTVDGQSLWPQTQTGITVQERSDTNCLINQFAINNFLYLVGDDGAGHPRFMNLAPWYDMLPQHGAPAAWSGTYSPLKGVQLNNSDNQEQAGDGFELLDVNNQITAYDIRVNQPFYDYVGSHRLYTSVALNAKRLEFNANSQVGGIWLPPTDGDGSKPGSIEIKTAVQRRQVLAQATSCTVKRMTAATAGVLLVCIWCKKQRATANLSGLRLSMLETARTVKPAVQTQSGKIPCPLWVSA